MSLCSVEKDESVESALRTLSDATVGRRLATHEKVVASDDSRSTSEGLALLGAYIDIADPHTRQAILDLVITAARGARA